MRFVVTGSAGHCLAFERVDLLCGQFVHPRRLGHLQAGVVCLGAHVDGIRILIEPSERCTVRAVQVVRGGCLAG